jgi:hypothetical protein
MRHRVVAAGSVALLVLSAALLVDAVQARLAVPASAPAVQPRVVASAGPRATEPVAREARRPRWRSVLAALDRRRARAYAAGDASLLREVYAAGSPVFRRDCAVLAAYRRRGLRVLHLRIRIADVEAQRVGEEVVVLRVRDRLTGGIVVGRGVRRRLRADAPDTRLVTLARVPGEGWRIAAVRGIVGDGRAVG